MLVLGHSEGGLVACKVAADLGPGTVSGVACLSGGGPTQLYDFLEMARTGHFFDQAGASPEEREKYVLDGWSGVMSEPQSPDKMWMGHSNLRWSTFCATSPMEELLKTPARVYIAQGSADQAVSPSTALMLQATLLSRGRDVRLNWIEGGDHGYAKAGETREAAGAAFNSVVTDAINWFLTSVPPQP